MSLLSEEKIGGLTQLARDIWPRRLLQWSSMDRITMQRITMDRQAQEVLTEAVCHWPGIPLEPSDVDRRTSKLVALFDYADHIGPQHWWARLHANATKPGWGKWLNKFGSDPINHR